MINLGFLIFFLKVNNIYNFVFHQMNSATDLMNIQIDQQVT